jgi:zinc/manganese transport system permease protein
MFVELLQSHIVQYAFLGGTIVAIITSMVGYFTILRAQAFAGEALTDIGFAGATAAALLGISSLFGMIGFTVLAALGIGALGNRMRGRDVEIGMVLSFALGLGVLFLTLYTDYSAKNASAGINILFGSVLSIQPGDIVMTLICGIIILIVLTIVFRPLLFSSIDPVLAQTRGVPVRLISIIFLLLLATTVAESILIIGVLLVTALLIAPAATAINLTNRPRNALIVSLLISLGTTWSGLVLTFIGTGQQLPVSFYIAAIAAACYFISVIIRRTTSPRRVRVHPHPDREERSFSTLP